MLRWLMASCLLLGLSAYLFAQDKESPKKEPPKKEQATPKIDETELEKLRDLMEKAGKILDAARDRDPLRWDFRRALEQARKKDNGKKPVPAPQPNPPEKKDQQPAQPGDVIITINGKPVPARIQVVPVKPVPAPQPNPPEKKDQQPGKKD
jgi:C-terminal processing protease CtpA/Prc